MAGRERFDAGDDRPGLGDGRTGELDRVEELAARHPVAASYVPGAIL